MKSISASRLVASLTLFLLPLVGCISDAEEEPSGDSLAGDADLPGDPAGGDESPSFLVLRNAGPMDPPRSLAPDSGEEGYWCAARLTPTQYPVEITRVGYQLIHGEAGAAICDATLAHRIQLWSTSSVVPPADGAADVTVEVPGIDESDVGHIGRKVVMELETPLPIEEGEHLIAAVELLGTHPNVMCMTVNDVDPYEGDRNYWSNAAEQPYSWVQLDSFGLQGSVLIEALAVPAD